MYTVNNLPLTLCLGRVGENIFRAFKFDVEEWLTEFPNGTVSVVLERPDGELYPVVVGATENPVVYIPTATDTAVSGQGILELRLLQDDVVGKSTKVAVIIDNALGSEGEPPIPPAPDWTVAVAQNAADAIAAAERAESAMIHSPQLGSNNNWFVWDATNSEYVDTGVNAGGEAPYIGDNGDWFIGDDDTGVKATGVGITSAVVNGDGDLVITYTDGNVVIAGRVVGQDGLTPYIGGNGNWFIGTVDTGVIAEGRNGEDGITPHIGDNGNWYIGATDTGVKAEGRDGQDGISVSSATINASGHLIVSLTTGNTIDAGVAKGTNGQSAYEAAQLGGYTDTESKFYADLAAMQGLDSDLEALL